MPIAQGLPFARNSHTSWKSAVSIASQPKARATKLAHYCALSKRAGDFGLTDPEASEQMTELLGVPVPVSSICSIRGAVMEQGLVGRGGERAGLYGKQVSAWVWIGGESNASR